MRLLYCTLISLLCVSISFAQPKSKQVHKNQQVKNELHPVRYKLGSLINTLTLRSIAGRLAWGLAFRYHQQEYNPKPSEQVISDIDVFLRTNKDKFGTSKEYQLISSNKEKIVKIFNKCSLIGSHMGEFFCNDSIIPVEFTLKDNALAFLITGIASEEVFNTLRLTMRERATKIISSMILPTLKKIGDDFNIADVRYLGITVHYGSKDFSDDLSLEAEMVALITPVEKCKKYAMGEITEDELLEVSDIFISDRDLTLGVRKVKLSLN